MTNILTTLVGLESDVMIISIDFYQFVSHIQYIIPFPELTPTQKHLPPVFRSAYDDEPSQWLQPEFISVFG